MIARYVFMEIPNIIATLRAADAKGVEYAPEKTVYIVGRENPVLVRTSDMARWRKRLFAFMAATASSPPIILAYLQTGRRSRQSGEVLIST